MKKNRLKYERKKKKLEENNADPEEIEKVKLRVLPNYNMGTAHAEIAALQRAYEAGLTQGQHVELVIGGTKICGHCEGDLPKMLEKTGVTSATIYDKSENRIYHWNPSVRSLHVKTKE